MTRLVFVAAAFAAGMSFVAAHAEEPAPAASTPSGKISQTMQDPGNAPMGKYLLTHDDGTPRGQPAEKAAAPAQPVDPIETSATARTERPAVTFKARKSVRGDVPVAAVPSGGARSYGSIVARYAAAYGIPASLAHAVIRVESNYRANARGSAGEIGLMQIKPATARGLGYRGSAKGLFDPDTNIRYGMLYLAKAHTLAGGNTCGTILRYNAGHAAKRMNPVSAAYCSKVKQHIGS